MAITLYGNKQNVVQVAQTIKSDVFSTTSTSWIGVTGFSVNITPTSTSSKILIMYATIIGCSYSGYAGWAGQNTALYRNGTKITAGVIRGSEDGAATANPCVFGNVGNQHNYCYLDAPATTSQITYQVYFKAENSGYTHYVGGSGSTSGNNTFCSVPSSIIVMEIANAQ